MRANILILALMISGALSSTVFGDVKIKSKQTMSGQSYENTTYIKGKRQRAEQMNGMTVSLTQCDLRRGVQMNTQSKTYMVNPFAQTAQTTTASATSTTKNGVVQAGGKITTTYTIKDTGERKQMFGFQARHLIITMESVSSPDACNKTNTKMQTDGWYIDAEFVLDCDYGIQNYNYNNNRSSGCPDKYEMKTIGTAKRGYPVYEKMTMLDESGKEIYSMVNEVVELSKATLDASLFEIPQDYREVSDAAQMYAGMTSSSASTATSSQSSASAGSSGLTSAIRSASISTSASGSSVGAKREGTVRIGLANVKTGAVGDGISAADLSAAVQNSLVQYLKAPNIEVVVLESKLSSVIDGEAREKDCDYVIYTNVSHKKGGGGFGGFGSVLGSAIGSVGLGHTGSVAGNLAGQVATQAIIASTVSPNVKAKDEITLDLKLNKAGGAAALAKVYKAKAKSNGDDIISQVIEQAAQAIVTTVGG
ncbi:MAG: hypothetical protein ABI791_04920 [Acidobacteriota bacterium]